MDEALKAALAAFALRLDSIEAKLTPEVVEPDPKIARLDSIETAAETAGIRLDALIEDPAATVAAMVSERVTAVRRLDSLAKAHGQEIEGDDPDAMRRELAKALGADEKRLDEAAYLDAYLDTRPVQSATERFADGATLTPNDPATSWGAS